MTKNEKAAKKKYEENIQKFLDKHIQFLGDHLVSGQEFLEHFKTKSTYYTSWGFEHHNQTYRYKLLALLPVNNKENTYHRTCTTDDGQMYVAAFLMPNRSIKCDLLWDVPEYQEWAQEHPFTLFFLGCDDGSYSKRFKTEADAIAYLNQHKTLEDIIEDNIGLFFYEELKKKKQIQSKEECFNIFNSLLSVEN